MMTKEEIVTSYNLEKQVMLNYALKNNDFEYGITGVDIEQVVDELLIKLLRSKIDFDKSKFRGFMFFCLRKNIRTLYAKKRVQNMPSLTHNERMDNYNLARDIINTARSTKKPRAEAQGAEVVTKTNCL